MDFELLLRESFLTHLKLGSYWRLTPGSLAWGTSVLTPGIQLSILVPSPPPQLSLFAVRITTCSTENICTASDDSCGGGLGTRLTIINLFPRMCEKPEYLGHTHSVRKHSCNQAWVWLPRLVKVMVAAILSCFFSGRSCSWLTLTLPV